MFKTKKQQLVSQFPEAFNSITNVKIIFLRTDNPTESTVSSKISEGSKRTQLFYLPQLRIDAGAVSDIVLSRDR